MALSRVDNKFITSLESSKLFGDFPDSPQVDGSGLTGIEGVDLNSRYNLALNYFGDSVRNNKDRLSLDQGWVDTFEDASDIVGEGFNVPLTVFDDTNDYLRRGDLTGITDGKEMTISFWFERGADSTQDNIIDFGGNASIDERFLIYFHPVRNNLCCYGKNSAGSLIMDVESVPTHQVSDGLKHFTVSVDLATGQCKMVFNGVQVATSAEPGIDQALDFTGGTVSVNGRNISAANKFKGKLGQLWFDTNFIDLTVSGNRAKFYNVNGKDLGTDGSTPTGSQPLIYLNNQADTFQNNLGSGGNFTENGQLVDGGYLDTNALYSSESFSNSYELIDSHGKENQAGSSNVADQQSSYSSTNAHANIITLPDCIIRRYAVLAKKNSGSTGNVIAFISNVASGTIAAATAVPSDVKLGTATLDISTVGTSFGIHYFDFSEPIQITAGEYAVGTEYNGVSPHGFQRAVQGVYDGNNTIGGTSDPNGMHARRINGTGWVGIGEQDFQYYDDLSQIFYLYGNKNVDLITKGSDDIGNSPSAAPDTGHMEILMTESYTKTQTQVAQTYGTAFGNMTAFTGDNSKAFDGVNDARASDGTDIANGRYNLVTPNGHYFVGKDWGAGNSKIISGVKTWGSNNEGYTGGTGKVSTALLMGSNTQPTQASQGTILGSIFNKLADVNNAYPQEKLSGFASTAYRYHWIWLTNNTSSGDGFFAEIEFYEETDGNETATLNTDIIAKMSRNGGTDYSNVTLTRTKTQVMGTDYNMLVGEADFTDGDATGTNIIGKIYTANKDKITVTGVSVNWK